jgi:hypothetical protein
MNSIDNVKSILAKLWENLIPPQAKKELSIALILAMIQTESGAHPCAFRYEPKFLYTNTRLKRPENSSANSEIFGQKTSWGLLQIMGATARMAGFEGWFPQLCDIQTNLEIALPILVKKWEKYHSFGMEAVIASWNSGSPKFSPEGRLINRRYVEKVLAYLSPQEATEIIEALDPSEPIEPPKPEKKPIAENNAIEPPYSDRNKKKRKR